MSDQIIFYIPVNSAHACVLLHFVCVSSGKVKLYCILFAMVFAVTQSQPQMCNVREARHKVDSQGRFKIYIVYFE